MTTSIFNLEQHIFLLPNILYNHLLQSDYILLFLFGKCIQNHHYLNIRVCYMLQSKGGEYKKRQTMNPVNTTHSISYYNKTNKHIMQLFPSNKKPFFCPGRKWHLKKIIH